MADFTVGLDFGSSKTAIVASNGQRAVVETVVGRPKDRVAARSLERQGYRQTQGKTILFGEDCYRERLALNIVRPCEKAMLKYLSPEEAGLDENSVAERKEAIQLLLQHVVGLVNPPPADRILAVMGIPSRSSQACKHTMIHAAEEVFDSVLMIPEPFAVSYGVDQVRNILAVDIGAGTVDICPIFNSFPLEEDQVTIPYGGDRIDQAFCEQLAREFPDAELSVNMAREIKERFGCVHGTEKVVNVELPTKGGSSTFDVARSLRAACETIVDSLVEGIREVVSRVDPEFRNSLLGNILLCGGGSQLAGLDRRIEDELKGRGANVHKVYDFKFAGAVGAHRMAMELTHDEWQQIPQLNQPHTHGDEQQVAA